MYELRKQKLNAEVIVISAAKDKDTIKMMLQNGAIDYIMKPFKFDRMKQALEKFRQYRESLKMKEQCRKSNLINYFIQNK